jgi:hypothetical protein
MKKLAIVVAVVASIGTPVFAADMAVKAPPTLIYKAPAAAVVDDWYVSADGMYENVKLPSSSLGWHGTNGGLDVGPLQTYKDGLGGGGGRYAIGYFVPSSAYRLELGGSYLSASGSSSQLRASQPGENWLPVLLNGVAPVGAGGGFNCAGGFFAISCTVSGVHHTGYDSWQLFGKAAYDWKFNTATVTPSLAVFGGTTNENQELTQLFTQQTAIVLHTGNYAAATRLNWSDVGARAGLDASVPLTVMPALAFAVSGWIGFAERHVSLTGSDSGSDTLFGSYASAIATNNDRITLLANLEAGLAYKVTSNVTVRGFAGVNFDDKVPGISTPGYGGDVLGQTPIPAQINFSAETNYYGGGGFMWRF